LYPLLIPATRDIPENLKDDVLSPSGNSSNISILIEVHFWDLGLTIN